MNPADALACRVVERMRSHDSFSHWLGIELVEVAAGRTVLRARIRKEMVNSLGTCHGGVTFALADTALGFAGNTHGRVAVSIDGNISFTKPVREGDVLTLTAQEVSNGNTVSVYTVSVVNQHGEQVAAVRGTQYKLAQEHFPGEGGKQP